MNKKLLQSLAILALAFLVGQCELLPAQSGNIRSGTEFPGIHHGVAPANSPADSRQPPESHPDRPAEGMEKTKSYKFRSIDYPGASYSVTYDFNGTTAVGCTITNAFTFQGSSYLLLSVPGHLGCGYGINTSGTIVGTYLDSSNNDNGFLYDGSRYTTIDYPGAVSTYAWGINDAGLVVGYYIDSNVVYGGFLYSNGTFKAISFPDAAETVAYSINSRGDIVGSYDFSPSSNAHGFLLSNGMYSSIDFPLADATVASGINDAGSIAGYYHLNSTWHGFTYAGGVFTQEDVPGATETLIYRINNKNNVVGFVTDSLQELHGIIGH